jgi:hypothetical protein
MSLFMLSTVSSLTALAFYKCVCVCAHVYVRLCMSLLMLSTLSSLTALAFYRCVCANMYMCVSIHLSPYAFYGTIWNSIHVTTAILG